jgi:hypothetical protein
MIYGEHCCFTVGPITFSTYYELELCFAECAASTSQLVAQLQAVFVEEFSDNCTVFGKSPWQVAGGRWEVLQQWPDDTSPNVGC